jgi:hypothetical protein
MANKFAELRARMPSAAQARSRQRAAAILADLEPPDGQPDISRDGSSPASSPESSSSSPAASQD